jgi:hypothetical protein
MSTDGRTSGRTPVRESLLPIVVRRIAFAAALLFATAVAAEPLRLHGFALLRGASRSGTPFDDAPVSSQLQLGADWRPNLYLRTHVHLLARDDPRGSRRGTAGVVQAFVDATVPRGEDRLRILAGAFFLPGSRENVDALWESPYTITPSALNSWFGEEFRPIGVDVSYTARRALTVGATVFRGNETFGAFLADRGWALRDRWSVLGEHAPTNNEYFTSLSAENDGRLGWAARAAWTSNYATVGVTHIDNRADGLQYPGHLLNWATTFDMAGFDFTRNDWTVAGEAGWGETSLDVNGVFFPTDILAAYLLVSRRLGSARVSVRADDFRARFDDTAYTAALLWSPRGWLRTGVEVSRSGSRTRGLIEMRYYFGSD